MQPFLMKELLKKVVDKLIRETIEDQYSKSPFPSIDIFCFFHLLFFFFFF
jgi:hypothetical protein